MDADSVKEETSSEIQACSSSVQPSNPCPICLGSCIEESYLDTCYHKFCYKCIKQWARVVASKHHIRSSSLKCPLCKIDNFSILHGYDGHSFQQLFFNRDSGDSTFFTNAHKYRLQCYYVQSVEQLERIFNVPRFWKLSKYRLQNQWLQKWLQREVQALIQEEDIDIILHHILGVIDSFLRSNPPRDVQNPEIKQEEFKTLLANASKPFMRARTDRFVQELELFLASGLNIEAYDTVYMHHLGCGTPNVNDEERNGEFSFSHRAPFLLYVFDDDVDETD